MAKNSADILKEYLVSIGFQVDERQFKNFRENIDQTDKRLIELGKIAVASAAALGASVTIMAGKMENLYFASQRTRSSVGNLQAFRFAAEQIGVSADDALGAVGGLVNTIRANPGMIGQIRQLGVDPNQEGTQLVIDLLDKLKAFPEYQAIQYASLFGMDQNTFLMMERGLEQLKQFKAERKAIFEQAGIDPDEAAQKSHRFMLELRELTTRWEALSQVIAIRFLPVLGTLVEILKDVTDWFLKADKATDGWSSKLLGLGVAIGGTATTLSLLKGGLSFFGIGAGAAAGGAAAGATAGGATLAAGGAGAGAALATKASTLPFIGTAAAIGSLEWWILHRMTGDRNIRARANEEDVAASNRLAKMGFQFVPGLGLMQRDASGRWVKATRAGENGVPLHNPGNLRAWGDAPRVERFSKGASIGNFAAFGSDEEGLSAMAGQLLLDYHRGFDTVRKEISKYAPPEENDTSAYIQDVVKRMGIEGQDTPLNLNDPTALQSLMAAMIHHEQGRDAYNPDLINSVVNARLGQEAGGKSVTLHQKTEIHVIGSGDSKDAANHVIASQDNVNNTLVRNLKGTVE